jgi:hypothetical protein
LTQISRRLIEDDAVGATKILLENNLAERARNTADTADVDLFKLGTDDKAKLLGLWDYPATVVGTDPKEVVNVEYINSKNISGRVLAINFTGSPRKTTVTLSQTLPNTSYSVAISGVDARAWTVESLTITSFIINSNASLALTGDVRWQIQINNN